MTSNVFSTKQNQNEKCKIKEVIPTCRDSTSLIFEF